MIPNWSLRSIFAWFHGQLLKDLVSWGSPGECSMIDHYLRDASRVLSCQFWCTVLQCGARLQIHTLNYWTVHAVSGARFLPGGVFECDIAHRRSVAVLCMLYKIRCNPMHPLNDALPGPYAPVRVTRGALVAYRYTYAPPRCRTSQYRRTFVFSSQCPSGMILLTPYSVVWDWRVSRAGQCFYIGLTCSILTIVFYYFSLSLFPV